MAGVRAARSVSPKVVPPPPALGERLHFNDWMLAFTRPDSRPDAVSVA
ncbi:MAG TPA: hypothetical protein VML55_22350 [Planctomycetaceae bacterium]|nr:hypothetical protein [Planctomycetaceae bacterium]